MPSDLLARIALRLDVFLDHKATHQKAKVWERYDGGRHSEEKDDDSWKQILTDFGRIIIKEVCKWVKIGEC